MSDAIIHNIRISYDDSHDRVREFVKYLQDDKRREEVKAYYEEAYHHSKDNKIHLNDKFGNEFTLECPGEHICHLGLRGM
jgi:hypothetical protein